VKINLSLRTPTFVYGQQPYFPDAIWQQVSSPGQYPPPGHGVLLPFVVRAGVFICQGTLDLPLLQVDFVTSQVVPEGQQWRWSLQHTACNTTHVLVTKHPSPCHHVFGCNPRHNV